MLVAWRSQEQAYNMKKKFKAMEEGDSDDADKIKTSSRNSTKKKRKTYSDGIGPERMPDEFFDEQGDFNLSKVKGEQARQYFERVLKLPMPPNMITKQTPADEGRTLQIREAYGVRGERPVRPR